MTCMTNNYQGSAIDFALGLYEMYFAMSISSEWTCAVMWSASVVMKLSVRTQNTQCGKNFYPFPKVSSAKKHLFQSHTRICLFLFLYLSLSLPSFSFLVIIGGIVCSWHCELRLWDAHHTAWCISYKPNAICVCLLVISVHILLSTIRSYKQYGQLFCVLNIVRYLFWK